MKRIKILVTGGAGFIGSHIVDRLVSAGHLVCVIDDLSGGSVENLNPYVGFYECDLRDAQKADKIISKIKPDIVYHLAANAAEGKSHFSPIDITSRNYNSFINTLVPAIKSGMKRIVVTSSIAVYGALKTPFKETDTPQPEDLYGLSKLEIEKSLEILSKVHNFEYVITRPHNVYGPRQNMRDPYRNVVTIFMNSLLNNKPYYLYGDGEMRRCFSYIDGVAEAIYKCGFADVDKMIFNIGSDKDYSIKELSEIIQSISDVKVDPINLPSRPQEVIIAISDITRAKKYLNYSDSISLEDGLKITWEYAKSLGPQVPLFTEVELPSEKLPKNWQK